MAFALGEWPWIDAERITGSPEQTFCFVKRSHVGPVIMDIARLEAPVSDTVLADLKYVDDRLDGVIDEADRRDIPFLQASIRVYKGIYDGIAIRRVSPATTLSASVSVILALPPARIHGVEFDNIILELRPIITLEPVNGVFHTKKNGVSFYSYLIDMDRRHPHADGTDGIMCAPTSIISEAIGSRNYRHALASAIKSASTITPGDTLQWLDGKPHCCACKEIWQGENGGGTSCSCDAWYCSHCADGVIDQCDVCGETLCRICRRSHAGGYICLGCELKFY